MKKKSILVGALLAQSMFTFADAKFSVADLTIAAGEQRTVAVNLELTDESELSTFEMEIQLPAHLTFKGFDEVTTTTDYGWVLTRSKINDGRYKFVGFAKKGAKLTPANAAEKLAFNFDVVADNAFNPKTAGDIEIQDLLATDGDQPKPYTVKGAVTAENGKIDGIYRLFGKNNKVTIDDGQTEVQFDLTPKHTKVITVELTNPKVEDIPYTTRREDIEDGGDDQIRGLQGTIHLPKGLKIKGDGTLTARTINEDLTLGTPEEEKDAEGNVIGTTVTFSIYASSAPLRKSDVYGKELFEFELEGDGVENFNEKQVVVTIDNFVASKYKDSKRYTMDDQISITVDNPNEVAMDEVWAPEVDTWEKALAAQIKKIETDNSNVRNYEGIIKQEDNAQKAIDALKAAIWAVYEAGDLRDNSDFQALIDEADKQINEILNKEVEKAEQLAADNNKLADDALQGINPEAPVPPQAISKDDSEGTIGKAKEVYEDALKTLETAKEQAATDGTQADENVYEAELKAVQEAADGIQKAIDEVQKKADDNIAAAQEAKNTYALPDNVKADDTPGTWKAAADAIDKAIETAAGEGTQAKDGIYDDAIADLKKALEEVIAKADANNKLITDAVAEYDAYTKEYTESADYQEIRDNQGVKDAVAAFDAAKEALETAQAEAAKPENGTQAKDDVYKEQLDEFAAAEEALKKEIADKHDIAVANEKEVADKLAETFDPGTRFDDIDETQEVAAAMEAWQKAKVALEEALQNSKDNGLLADDQYLAEDGKTKLELDDAIQTVTDKLQALQDAIDAATEAADDLDEILTDKLADLLNDELNELAIAKVVDPSTVKQADGKLTTKNWQMKYDNLKAKIKSYVDNIENDVEALKAKFFVGGVSLDLVNTYIEAGYDEDAAKAMALTETNIINYLKTAQRGDVGGDGRWTTHDYALLRKVILNEEYPAPDGATSAERYEFARMDINQDGDINVGDAQAALNYTFYGSIFGEAQQAARSTENSAETMTATMNGNVIAINLNNSRRYSALQMDVVLAEGMSVAGAKVAGRTAGYSVATAELANGATRILLTANEAGQAFEGSEGSVLFIEVAGMGQVEFENIILADLNASTAKFSLNGVSGGTTGIAGVNGLNGDEQVYSLGGRMMNALKKGVNIIRRADGSTQKVIKK